MGFERGLNGLIVVAFSALLMGCAGLPPVAGRQPSKAIAAPAEAPLVALAAGSAAKSAAESTAASGFWPLPQAAFALDARLALIRNARSSLDLQYYLIGNDTVGRLVLRELRDAAIRGVRVRLLVDDLYTLGLDPLLEGLAATPNIEVELFNPFGAARGSGLGRLASFAGDFRRLNHRMHNKLLVADGAVAVVGGRNLADEYFLRSKESNFLDMDVLATGALVARLGELFDSYWNSEQAVPLRAVVASNLSAGELQQRFDAATASPAGAPVSPPADPDVFGEPAFSAVLAGRSHRFVMAEASAYADSPVKARGGPGAPEARDTVTSRFIGRMHDARSELLLISPYFIPGPNGLRGLREARQAGVEVRVVTNAIGTSDEPLVNLGYERYRNELLRMGVKLYELSASQLVRDPDVKRALGGSQGRLHAKMAFIDRQTVLVGSMNLDLRSAYTNTEIGIAVRSPELAGMILAAYKIDDFAGVFQVRLKPDGAGVQWIGRGENGEEEPADEPDVSLWQRFKLWLMSLFVPEDML